MHYFSPLPWLIWSTTFRQFWCKMLSQDKEHLFELAHRASLRGLINFKQVSEVIEVTFPNIELPNVVQSKEQG